MKKPVFEKIKPLFQKKGKASVHGSYSAGYTALFLAVLLMGNLIVSRLPSKYTKIDLSGSGLYSIGDQTKAVLDGLSEDVTLYLVCQEGNEDSTVTHLLEQYAENSDHVTLETKDPVKSPTFTQTYTTDQVADNSVIVVSGDRSKVISYADIYTGDYDYSTGGYSSSFDGEGQLTSAIAYVTTDDLPVLYVVTGHDEAEISSTVRSTIEKENIRLEDLNLMTDTDVPEDAAGLFLYAPMSDYSEEEAAKIIAYLEKGGKSLIISSYTETELPNFQSILSAYGIRTGDGLVLEGDPAHTLSQNPLYLVPEYGDSSIASSLESGKKYVAVPIAQPIETLEAYRDSLTMTPILVTSDSSYEKADLQNMESYAKEAGDQEGPFTIGMEVTEQLEDAETKIIYYTTEGILDDTMNRAVAGGNMELLANSLSDMADHETSVSIAAKSLDASYLTVTSAAANLWSIVATAVLPLGVLILGGVVCYRRRKR